MKLLKPLLTTSFLIAGCLFFVACNNENSAPAGDGKALATRETQNEQSEVHGSEIKSGEVELNTPLNQGWVANGKGIYEMKCQSCHKLTDERVVGPGWKGVTQRREPHWIMNMITNVDMMLEKDPEAQKLLEQCLVRMPNQNIAKEDARQILEFMRSNDGAK
ncbi:cytochrome c [Niastella caeni]|uniref:Cytochrome c n=1 Tax=Niastella caeni TaxID=2569763 RepID=A0A4S8H9L3_9BACT|nr:c-type cytochrome [Niastella caeni]THU30729.1 cytochrome c [Niastella caeni]